MRNISTAKTQRERSAAAPPAEGRSTLPFESDVRDDVGQIIETIIYLYTESRRITKELAKRAQLTGPQLTVVKLLETIGDLSLTELSEKIRAQNSTVTGIIDRMEREGLVLRERSTEDRRVVKIRLTPKGMDLARDVPVEPMVIFRSALESLSPNEMQDLLKILLKVSRKVKSIVRKEVSQP
jgi:DNA-binding MarR family transcriptional regulator